MKAKFFTLILAVLLLSVPAAMGESAIIGDFELGIGSESVSLLKYVGEGSIVNIPDNYAGLPLTTIGDKAFYEMQHVVGVNIPGTVMEIGDKAFYDCDGISFLYVPSSVNLIGEDAFSNCDNLMLSFEDGSYAQQYAMAADLEYQFYDLETVANVEEAPQESPIVTTYGDMPMYTEAVYTEDENFDEFAIEDGVTVIDTYTEMPEEELQTIAP